MPPLFFDCTLVIVYWTWCRLYYDGELWRTPAGHRAKPKTWAILEKSRMGYHDRLMIFHVKLINRE